MKMRAQLVEVIAQLVASCGHKQPFSFERLGQQVIFLARVSKKIFDRASCVHSSLRVIFPNGMLVIFPTIGQEIKGI